MAKNNKTNSDEPKADKAPKDFSTAVAIVKVIGIFILIMASLYMVGLLKISDLFVQVLGYGLMTVTVYFAISVVK